MKIWKWRMKNTECSTHYTWMHESIVDESSILLFKSNRYLLVNKFGPSILCHLLVFLNAQDYIIIWHI